MPNRQKMMEIANIINEMPKGHWLDVSREDLNIVGRVQLAGFGGPMWEPDEWIMENVIGSTWTIDRVKDPATGKITFKKLLVASETPLFISPDRRYEIITDQLANSHRRI